METYLESVAQAAVLDVDVDGVDADVGGEDAELESEDPDLESGDAELRRTVRCVFAAVCEHAGDELANAADQLPPEYEVVVEPGDRPIAGTFVEAVREEIALGDEAEAAAEATLRVLGQRLSQGQAEDLAAYLQGDAAGWLLASASTDPEAFSRSEFVQRVAGAAHVSGDRAREYVAAVATALEAVVPDRELARAVEQLPDEYAELFEFDLERAPQ